MVRFLLLSAMAGAASLGCASSGGPSPGRSDSIHVAPREGAAEVGVASYYAHRFHGRRTAYGEIYDERALTAAHPSLPHGTRIRVTNLANGQDVLLRVNDRGPWGNKRVIDVSYAAAKRLGFVRAGLTRVRLEVVAAANGEDAREAEGEGEADEIETDEAEAED